jgi:WD40 repeat protein
MIDLTGHTAPVRAAAFSPDGRLLATAGDDRSIIIWDVATGTRWATLAGHDQPVTTIAWGPGGTSLISGSEDHTVLAWTMSTEAVVHHLCDKLAHDFHIEQAPPQPCLDPSGR